MRITRYDALLPVMALLLGIAACAPTVVKTHFPYRPSLALVPGKGTVAIVAPEHREGRRDPSGGWILGEVKTPDGKEAAKVVADAAPEELILQALADELKKAGYSVERVADLQGKSGLRLATAGVSVGEVVHPVTVEAKSEATITADVVIDGKVAVRLTYVAKAEKTTVRGSGNPAEEVLGSSVHDLLGQALPGLLKELEKKTE